MHKIEEDASVVLTATQQALARGDVAFIRDELNEVLQVFRINLENCLRGRAVRVERDNNKMIKVAPERSTKDRVRALAQADHIRCKLELM